LAPFCYFDPVPEVSRRNVASARAVAAGAFTRAALAVGALVVGGGCTRTHDVLDLAADGAAAADARADAGADATDGASVPPVATVVSTGSGHTCAIASGALYCWGANDEGRLGLGDTTMRLSPARVGTETGWLAVVAGARHTVALKQDGSLWAFGANDNGQLGQGDFTARQSPARVGNRGDWVKVASRFNHVCALAGDGSLWCWGANAEGQLGQDDVEGTATDRAVPTAVTDRHDWTGVDAGDGHSCAVRADGTLWCWGRNSEAELGQGSADPLEIRRPTQVGTDTDWQLGQSGQSFTCGLRGGALYCWGSSLYTMIPGSGGATTIGAPLLIDTSAVTAAPLADLSINTFGGCVLSAAGESICWGRNVEGQLGLGDYDERVDPTLLPGDGWSRISVGRFTLCGVRQDTVVCVGDNRNGQLGRGDLQRQSVLMPIRLP